MKTSLKKTANYNFKICIIGAGRVGTTFAAFLTFMNLKNPSLGFKINAICSRTNNSLDRAKTILSKQIDKLLAKISINTTNSKVNKKVNKDFLTSLLFTQKNIEGVKDNNVILICTPDDEIEKVSNEILNYVINNPDFDIKNKIFVHFSGAKSLSVLKPIEKAGGFIACIHPIKSFASIEESIKTIKNTVYGVTLPENCPLFLRTFVDSFIKLLKGKIIEVQDSKKSIYHAAACVASNYLVALVNYAISINEKIGINPDNSLKGLTGLIEGTVNNIKKLGTKKALTGPIARGDVGTLKEHIESFKKYLNEQDYFVYKVLGIETANIAYENGWISKDVKDKFYEILKY